jgi:putative membrane protein insertion efficiency factor
VKIANVAIFLIRAYQILLGPLVGGACRFEPSCSEYAVAALRTHGPFKGLRLAVRRVARCHPFGGFGYDPVPPCGAASGPARHEP